MAYGDLLRALQDEVREQVRALRESARAEAERLGAEARRLASEARVEALARAEEENAALRRRAVVRASLTEERLLLVERRRLVEGVRAAALARLPGLSTPELTCRLLDEALGDDDGSRLEAVVDPGHAEACRAHLAAARPELAGRTAVVEADRARGGVELRVGDRLVVDDTLPARLAHGWPRLEVEVAARLFGEPDGRR